MSALGIAFLATLLIGLILYSDAKSITQSLESGQYSLIYTVDGKIVYALTQELAITTEPNEDDFAIIVSKQWLWDNVTTFNYQGESFTQEKFLTLTQGSDEEKALALTAAFAQKIDNFKGDKFLRDVISKKIDLRPQPLSTRILQQIPLEKIKNIGEKK